MSYAEKVKQLQNIDAQETAEIKQKFPKLHKANKASDALWGKVYKWEDSDVTEGTPEWDQYETDYNAAQDSIDKITALEDHYGPQGYNDLAAKYQQARSAINSAYDKSNSMARSALPLASGVELMYAANKLLHGVKKVAATTDKKSKKPNSSSNQTAALGGAVAGLGTAALADVYNVANKALPTRRTPSLDDLNTLEHEELYKEYPKSRMQDKGVKRRFETTAKRLGLEKQPGSNYHFTDTQTGRTINFNPLRTSSSNAIFAEDASNAAYNTARKNRLNPNVLRYAGQTQRKGINVNIGGNKFMQSRGVMAHELGHAKQNKNFLRAAGLGRSVGVPLGILGGVADAALRDDSNGGIGYGIAGLSAATTLANELNASYKGSKAFKSLRGKASAFKGIPTYTAFAAAPAVAYGVTRYIKNKMRRNQEKTVSKKEKRSRSYSMDRLFASRGNVDQAVAGASGIGALIGASKLQAAVQDKAVDKLTDSLRAKVTGMKYAGPQASKSMREILKRQRNARALIAGSILAGTAIPAARHLYQDYKAKTASNLTAQLHAYKERLHN